MARENDLAAQIVADVARENAPVLGKKITFKKKLLNYKYILFLCSRSLYQGSLWCRSGLHGRKQYRLLCVHSELPGGIRSSTTSK